MMKHFLFSLGLALGLFSSAEAQFRPGFPPGFRPGFQFPAVGNHPIRQALADYDFKANRYSGPPLSVSRASTGYIDDSYGQWSVVPANTARRSDKGVLVEEARTNSIRNSSMQGAIAGTPGTGPTSANIRAAQTGMTTSIALNGPELGVETIDITAAGTAPAINTHYYQFDSLITQVPVSAGQTWTASIFVKALLATGVSSVQVQTIEYLSDGTTTNGITSTTISPTSTLGRYSHTKAMNANTAFIVARFSVNYNVGAVDARYRIGWPQLEQGAFATSPIRTTGTAATRAADVITSSLDQAVETLPSGVVTKTVGDGLSYVSRPAPAYISDPDGTWRSVPANTLRRSGSTTLVESAATNVIRNNSMAGGGAGVLPTYWAGNLGGNGITMSFIGTGTANGIDYVRIQVSGTSSTSPANVLFFDAVVNAMALSTGQTATGSVFARLVSGSFATETFDLTVRENGAGDAFIRQTLVNLKTMSSTWSRFANPITAGASTLGVNSGLRLGGPSGTTVNFTIDIGWPQLEAGLTATSPIRTTNAAVTRPADVVTRSGTMAGIGTPLAPNGFTGSQGLLAVSDGTTGNRQLVYRGGSNSLAGMFSGPPATSAFSALLSQGVRSSLAGGFSPGERAVSVGGGSSVTESTAGEAAVFTQVQVGTTGAGTGQWNGYIERVAVLPNRMSNADLQLLSSLSAWDAPFTFGVGTSFPAFASAVDYDFKGDRYYGPAISVSRASTAYIDDAAGNWVQAAANVLRRSNKGALIEEARTNGIRNNAMVGAVAGTPGTNPTNWVGNFATAGVTSSISSVTTKQGLDVIEYTVSGTPSSGSVVTTSLPETTAGLPASAGQVRTFSVFLGLSAGSMTGVASLSLSPTFFDSSNVVLTSLGGPSLTASMVADGVIRRYDFTYTAPANTAYVQPRVRIAYAATPAPVSFSLLIGAPQDELGAFATSPIRTTGTAATRAADAVTAPSSGLTAATAVGIAMPMAPSAGVGNHAIAAVSDGSTSNRITFIRQGADGRLVSNANPPNLGPSGPILAPQVRAAVAGAFASADRALSVGGAAVTTETTAGAFPAGLNVLQVGMSGGGVAHWNGYIERLVIYPTRVPNSRLQELSQLSSFGG